jgi:hypothetical protein
MPTPQEMALALVGIGERQYLESLGRFISAFAETEVNLQTVLWHFAGVPSPTAPAVFSGVRVDAAMKLINRIAEAQKWKKTRKEKLTPVFQRLGQITKLRNDILHYGAKPSSLNFTTWTVTNRLFAHTAARIRETHVSSETLDHATRDLQKISSHLIVIAWGQLMPRKTRASVAEGLKHAWRYKPPPEGGKARKSRKAPQKRKRQRPASRK